MIDTVKNMEQLVQDKANLELSPEFLDTVKQVLDRFNKKEIKFRRDEEEAKWIAEEERKKKWALAKKNAQK